MREKPKWYSGIEYFEPSFELAVATGRIPGASFIHKFGLNEAVAAAWETLWSMSTAYVYLTAETALNVSSGDVDDTAAGAGAQQVLVEGLDGGYNEIFEYVELNGQTAVATGQKYLRVHRMSVTRGVQNQGIVYIGTGGPASGVPTTTYGAIPATFGKTTQALYTIPAVYTGYLWHMDTKTAVSQKTLSRLMVRELGQAFHAEDVQTSLQSPAESDWRFPLRIPGKSDVELQVFATGAGGQMSGVFTILLIKE